MTKQENRNTEAYILWDLKKQSQNKKEKIFEMKKDRDK